MLQDNIFRTTLIYVTCTVYGSILHIFSKKIGEEVWKIDVGTAGKEKLEKISRGNTISG